MNNTKPHENLYNALNQQGYDIGDLEQFTEKLKDAQKRHALYDTISTEFNVGDFDNFESAINYLWINEDTQPIPPSQAIPQPLQENISLAMANPMDKVNPALRTQSTKPIGDIQASQNIGHRAEMTFNTPEQRSAVQVIADNDAIINSPSLIDSKVSKDPIKEALSQDLIGKATSQEWQRDTLNSVSGMRDEAKKKIKERAEELRNSGEDFDYSQWQQSPSQYGYAPMTTPGVKAPNLHSDREMNLYRLTIETLNEAQKHMETVRENQSRNGFQQAAAGIGDAIFDIDTLTLGLDSLAKNETLKAILDKADADQPLTQAEESLLNAALYKQFTEAALPNGRWYNIGKGIGEQVPYMLEFALSGGVAGALTKGASKAIGKQVVKYINNLALKNGSKIAKRTTRNVFTRGSRMLGNTLYQLPGGVMRAAAQVPLQSSVYNNIIERQIGTLGYKPGKDGALDYTGRIDADNTADAITKGLTSGFITNLTESVGGEGIQFITNKIGGIMGKGANAVFKNLQSPRWYNRLRESFRRNGFGEFVKATSWQGPVAEWGEEILDQTLNAIFVGDSSLDPNSENYVFDLDNLIDTAITTGAISLFMGAAGGLASGKIHRDVNKAYAQAKKNIDTLHYTDTEINALNNIATSRPQEASKWVSSITRTMRTLAIRSAEIENSLSPEARTLLAQPYTEAEFNELSPYDQQAVMALAEINNRFNDLTIQRDYVVAGTNYNALIKGLKESVAPQAEAAMADIQANALRDSDYTVKVKFKGQDGYLVSGTADIDNLPDGRTVATLPAGNIYQVRTKSPDGQWIIQQAVAEDIVPGSVTPTQQLIDETTARIYTPVQNLINAEQAQAQAEVAQSTEQTTPTTEQTELQTEQAQPSVETTPAGLNTPTAPNGTVEQASPILEQASPILEQASPILEQTTASADTKDLKDTIDSTVSIQSTNSTQAKLAHIASWQQAIDVPIVIFHDISEVDNPQAVANIQAGNRTPGWFTNGTVYIYLPHAIDERDIDATIMHECIAHFGLPRLFATQEQADAFYNEVWNAMPEAEQRRYLNYPGVSHLKGEEARRAAADEYIAHLAEQIRAKRAGEAEVSLWQRIVSFFRNALRRANVNLRLNDNDLTQLLLQSLDALKKNNEQPQETTPDNALDANEVAVTLPSNGTETRFSIRSFREEGRAKVTKWLNGRVKSRRITKQEAQDILDQLDTIYDICQEYTTQYAPFGDWSEAQVNVDANGNPVLSVIKSNGEYAMNLDFSLVCKKRRTLDAVFQEMIARDIINDFELDGVQVAKVNEIIRSYGFETACRLCFVDAKRFRIAAVADTFVELFNEISSMSDRKLRQVIKEEPTTVRGETAQLLLNDPSQRIKVSRSDFMSAEGFERIKRDYPEIMKLYNAKKGTGGPKASFGDVQYLNEIEKRHQWTPNKAYSVGGVRLQSFSDYVPRMVFDYVQMIADLAAKRLPVHAYTKEAIFAKQFGLTGIKINLSLVPRVDPDGMAPGLDRDGNYVWQENETFPYDTAIAIQNAPGYRDNCGTIAVGVSDAHILKMLDDENIRMVIPYHKSGLNPAVAIFNNIDAFVDYTNEQNTRYSNGTKLSKDEKQFNFNEALRKANGNPRIAAQQYLDWCRDNNYLPKFDKFASHPNYYKLLEDFTTMYTVDGVDTVVPQRAVEMRFPTEQDAFGSMRDLIAEGLEADAILEGQRNEQLSAIVDEIAATLPPKTKAKTKAKTKTANSQQTTTPTGLNAPNGSTGVNAPTGSTGLNAPDTRFRSIDDNTNSSNTSNWSPEEQDIIDRAKANGTYLLAPNGQPTNLTPRQWVQVRTRAFKEWFGDWESNPQNASKIVDENGEPRVVYHQTNAEEYVNVETGQEWDDLSWQEKMEWDNRDDWDEYWEPQDFYTFSRKNARTTNEFDGFFFAPSYDEYHEYGERTIEAFLNIRKPAGRNDYNIDSTYNNAGQNERLRLQEAGFDGVIREDDGVIDEFIAFEPNQIKSATDNIGTFDSNNPDIRFRIGDNEQTALLNAKQPKTSQPLVDTAVSDTRFRVTKRTKETIDTWLNKRTDLNTAERNAFWTYIENEEPAKQLAMGKWFANGAIRLPEDQPTVDDAMRMARKMNVDPLKYNAPGLITSEYHERFGTQEQKEKLLSPDDERFAGILTDKVDYGNGVTVYTVQDDAIGQDAVRELMNDHLGKNFNCWCLLYADTNGNITESARNSYWQHYSSTPKRVAFKDGKICSFCASDNRRTQWWDLSDRSHGDNIPIEMELPGDAYNRRSMYGYNEKNNKLTRIKGYHIFRGNKKNGLYEEWYNKDPHSLAIRANYKGGKLHGLYEEWHYNGKLFTRGNHKDGKRDGLYEEWHENGKLRIRENYKDGEYNGLREVWHLNGQLTLRETFKGGERDVLREEWYENGQPRVRANYKGGKRDGLYEEWHENGQLQLRENYKDGKYNGLHEEWYDNGQLESRTNFKNGYPEGIGEAWYENGQLAVRNHHKDNLQDGLYEEWAENGQLTLRENYKNGKLDGLREEWTVNGQLWSSENYKDGELISEGSNDKPYKRPTRFRSVEDLETIYSAVDRFTEQFKAVAPIVVIENTEQLRKLYADTSQKEFDEIAKTFKEASGMYDPVINKIIIFAENSNNAYTELLHENTHAAIYKLYRSNNLDSKFEHFIKDMQRMYPDGNDLVAEYYSGDEMIDELVAYTLSTFLQSKGIDVLLSKLSSQAQQEISTILNTIGYEKGRKQHTPEYAAIFATRENSSRNSRGQGDRSVYGTIHQESSTPTLSESQMGLSKNERSPQGKEPITSFRSINPGESIIDYARAVVANSPETRFRTSSEIEAEYPNWLDGTTTDSGKHFTQVEGTRKTYKKVGDWIEQNLGKDITILDASSGMGYGTADLRERGFNIDDVEPYQSKERRQNNPATFDSYDSIDKQYDFIISNAVLNVIPDDWRAGLLHDMAVHLAPGGRMFINTRKAGEEKSIKDKIELDSPQEILVKRNGRIASYQRFFTPSELKEWVQQELGEGYTVAIANKANSGTSGLAAVVVTKNNDPRLRSINPSGLNGSPGLNASVDTRTADYALDTIEQASADYADSLNNERQAIIDAITPSPGDSLRTIAEKTRLRSIGGELVTRDNTELEDFLAIANKISNAMTENDARHKHTAIAESQYDSMQRLHNLIDDLRKQGALIDDRFDPWLTQNQSRSRAQAETKVFDLTYRQPLYEAIARGIRVLFPGINTKDKAENAKGYSHLSLYAQARTAVERQAIKSAQARAEAEEKGEEYKEKDFGGLAGIQEAIFGLYSAIDNDVEAVKGNIEKLTTLATERGIPTVQEYIDNAEAKLGNPDTNGTAANQLWTAIRSISAYQLTYSYNAGLTSRAGYQTLTYGRNIDALLREKYDMQVKQIKDNPGSYDNVTDYDKDGNATGTRKVLNDNARIALNQLNQEYAEAIDAVPMPGKNGNWKQLIDTGWLTEEDVNSLHRYYMYYMPLKGHAELTAEDIVEYENKTPRNQSKIKAVEGHSHLAKDPFNQLILDTHGAIQNAEQNRWRLNLYNILTNNPNPSQYVIEQRFYKIETQSDGSKEYVPYGELKTINGAKVFIPGRPTAEELANGTAVSYNNRFTRAEVDIPIRNDQRKEHSVTVMVDGEAYNMFFYDKRIADAINGTNIKRPSDIWKQLDKLQALNRLYAGLKTSLNPTFTLISNLPRDWMEMVSNNLIEHGLAHAVTSFIYRVRATRAGDVQAALRKYQDGKLLTLADATSDVERYVVEFFNNGGSVNITQLPDYNTAKVELMDDLNTYMRTGEMPKGSWLSRNFNNMAERVELAPRLATYIASRTLGRNISQSVNDAKEATVNFDRKGSWSGIMGMMQLFYNAAAQSVRRQIGLARRHPVRFAATYATIGLLSPLNNIMMSYIMSMLLGDDDDLETIVRNYFAINPELRRRYNIILIGNDYIRIPMAVNYLPYVTLGDAIANWRLNPNYRPNIIKDTLDIASAILDTFLPSMIAQPIGFMFDAITAQNNVESANASRAIVFSLLNKIPVIEPLIQAVGNYNFMGSTLFDMPYDKNSQEPAYLRARQYTQPVWVWASHLLNDITGGNEVHAGWLNIAPEQIENVMTVFGGYGEYAENIISIGIETVSILSGEKPDTEVFKKSFPLLSRLYGGNTQERYDKSMQSMFYDDTTALAGFNEYRKNATTASTRADFDRTYSLDEQRYFADLATMESIAKKIRKEIKAATPEGEAPKYHEDERLKAIYNLANEQYHSLASGEYKPIDNPYYAYMYIKDAIEKAPHRTTDGTYRLIDRSDRSADSRGQLKQLLRSFSETRSMHNALPSGYYPGMPLDNREEQALNRFNTAVGELIQAYQNTDLNNLTPTDNAQ